MNNAEALKVAALVQNLLRESKGPAARVRVLTDEVNRPGDQETWYVPVSVHRDPEYMGLIYGWFSDIENRLEEEHGVLALIVPRIVPFQRWADIA